MGERRCDTLELINWALLFKSLAHLCLDFGFKFLARIQNVPIEPFAPANRHEFRQVLIPGQPKQPRLKIVRDQASIEDIAGHLWELPCVPFRFDAPLQSQISPALSEFIPARVQCLSE